MLRAIQKKLKNKKGFTLIELIVVIAILGIIAAIAVPKFTGIRDNAEQQATAAAVAVINKSIEVYKVQEDDENLATLLNGIASPTGANVITELIDAGYLDSNTVTTKPDGTAYTYDSTNHDIE